MNKYQKKKATLRNTSILTTLIDESKAGKSRLSFRGKRWIVIILIHLLFFLSFAIDIQILEGTLSGSRFLGIHLIDIFTSIEVFVATYEMHINVIIGAVTIIIVYIIIGGRTYCSWVCPYGLLSEIGEKIHNTLVEKKIIKERAFDHKIKYLFWTIFLLLALVSGYLVFELFNVVGILSRFFVYGWSIALVWVIAVLFVEIFYSRRAWCKYICPIGTTYGFIGWVGLTNIEWNDDCDHCMVCHDVCFENHILEFTKQKYDAKREEEGIKTENVNSGDCTLCGRCIDACHKDALKFNFRMKSIL